MKREEIKEKITGITDDQLDWLMGENGKDINIAKQGAGALQSEVDSLKAQLATAQEGLKAFEGVDVNDLKAQITKLQNDIKEQAKSYEFESALDAAIRDAKGRSLKAIRGMLDIDTLRKSENKKDDISKAIADLQKENPWAFGGDAGSARTGDEHNGDGAGGDGEDGVTARFKALNPTLKF